MMNTRAPDGANKDTYKEEKELCEIKLTIRIKIPSLSVLVATDKATWAGCSTKMQADGVSCCHGWWAFVLWFFGWVAFVKPKKDAQEGKLVKYQ